VNTATATREIGAEQESVPRRRLTEVSSPNPFMNGVCMDFLQDSTLQIKVQTFSVVIVARNEERSALIRTVNHLIAYCRCVNRTSSLLRLDSARVFSFR
jgi:hypothetical protein